jgi:hypothetical protein
MFFIAGSSQQSHFGRLEYPSLAAAVGSVTTLTVFHELICQAGPGHQQSGRDDRGQEVLPHAVAVVLLFIIQASAV